MGSVQASVSFRCTMKCPFVSTIIGINSSFSLQEKKGKEKGEEKNRKKLSIRGEEKKEFRKTNVVGRVAKYKKNGKTDEISY